MFKTILVAIILVFAMASGSPGIAGGCDKQKLMCQERCQGKSSDSRFFSLSGSAKFECGESCNEAAYYCSQGMERADCKATCKAMCANNDRYEYGRCTNECQMKCP
ncbi:MAG: hypothetical protein WCF85_17800 [Rhodospirillaceae bacterium]